MKAEIKVPAVGESITEATIAEWSKQNGEYVHRDDILLVLETDKASVEVVAENDGLLEIREEEGETVEIGAVIGVIDTEAAAPARSPSSNGSAPDPAGSPSSTPQSSSSGSASAHPQLQKEMSPAVRRVVNERGLDPANIEGSGRGGRITKSDAVNAKVQTFPTPATAKAPSPGPTPLPQVRGSVENQITREPMSRLRKTIATRLVEAQQTAAILTTFNEIDMTNVMELRKKYKDSFEKKYGLRLGFMGFFVKAAIEALKAFPKVNASIDGDDILYRNFNNVGIAVGTEKGLVVPVIKNAEQLSVAEIEMSIKHYADKARDGKISVDDLRDGTFTISNGGVYGSLMSTPILNPPQTGILGLHKIEERPMAVNGQVVIRPMMYVALSYDHRIIDGSESVQFLVKIKEGIEDPARLLLEI